VGADRVIIIDEGHILCSGTPKEIFTADDVIKKAGLELPQTAKMFNLLRKSGFDVRRDILSADEAFEYIKELIASGKIQRRCE